MTSNKIKARILMADYSTINEFADAIGERRDTVSAVIHYLRRNSRVQRKIERAINVRFNDRLFPSQPREKKNFRTPRSLNHGAA